MKICLHRYCDLVAVSMLDDHPQAEGTKYLTVEEAEELGDVLTNYARNVRATPFGDSEMGNYTVEVPNPTRFAHEDRKR